MKTNRRLLLAASIVLAMLMLVAGLVYLDNPPGPGVEIMANDFSTDSTCKALWRFESGSLLVDSVGGNDLTNDFRVDGVDSTLTTVVGTYKEGSGAVYKPYADPDYGGVLGIEDADLDAGFPLKNGDTAKIISFAGWIYHAVDETGGAYLNIVEKYHASNAAKRTLQFQTRISTGYIGLRVYHSAGNEFIEIDAGVQTGRWYHVGLALDGVAKTYLVRLYDATAAAATTHSGSITNELLVTDGPLMLGRFVDGYFDEFVVFSEIKTADDFDDMRDGIYAPLLTSTGLLDGKLIVYHITDYLDGRAVVYEPDVLDGRLAVNTPTETLDGLVAVQDETTGLLDGLMDLPLMVRTSTGAWRMIPPASQWALPEAQPRREVFVAVLRATGLADVEVPMTSMQMRRRDGLPTMVSCVVPDADTYRAYAEARTGGELIIMAGSITEDGTRHLSELDRATLESISWDIGVGSSSLSLSGYRTADTVNPRPVDLTGITYYGMQADGRRRARGKMNIFLRPGDTAILPTGESFVVDQIYAFVEPRNAWMEAAGL